MSEPENFIARWSRRKRDAAQERAPERERAADQDAEAAKPAAALDAADENAHAPEDRHGARDAEPAHGSASESAAFDLAKLPPIESIAADSDIRPFLAPSVPLELTRAALRRAWSADPAIREFVGLSENSWDFNAPGALAGFGPLEMTDELRRQVARMVGRSLAGEEKENPAPTPADLQAERPAVETSAESATPSAEVPTGVTRSNRGTSQNDPAAPGNERHNSTLDLRRNKVDTAAQYDPENPDYDQVLAKRAQGSALPK